MVEKISEKLISKNVDFLISEFKNLYSDLYDEAEQFVNISLRDYLTIYQKKYSKIKTLLHGNTPLNLYDVYYHVNIEAQNSSSKKAKMVNTKSVKNIFKIASKITIIGDAGSGKSTLVKHLFLNSLKEKIGIPILIELRYFNQSNDNLITYLKKEISNTELVVNTEILERYLNKGKFIFFLDGYDELNSEIVQKVIKDLNSFIRKYNSNNFILTSRPYTNVEMLSDFYNFEICDLNKKDVKNFVRLQLKEEIDLAEKIVTSIQENKNKKFIGGFLKNPLLLSLYILTFQSNSSIPDKKYIFYRRVINALFLEHDSKTKLGYRREKKSKLSQEEFEEVLKRFSFLSYFSGHFIFTEDYMFETFNSIRGKLNNIKFTNRNLIDDLLLSVAIWTEDGGKYSFAHRSIQEYFATLFISGLNEKNKKSVYNKIMNNRDYSERENLISLCKEMDLIHFTKFLHIPALKKIDSYLNKETSSLLENYLRFLFNSFSLYYDLNNGVIRSLSHNANDFAMRIDEILSEGIISQHGNFILNFYREKDDNNEFKFIKCKGIKELIEKKSSNRKKSENGEVLIKIEYVLNYFDTDEINKNAHKFNAYISERIEKLEFFVETSEQSDSSLLSMI